MPKSIRPIVSCIVILCVECCSYWLLFNFVVLCFSTCGCTYSLTYLLMLPPNLTDMSMPLLSFRTLLRTSSCHWCRPTNERYCLIVACHRGTFEAFSFSVNLDLEFMTIIIKCNNNNNNNNTEENNCNQVLFKFIEAAEYICYSITYY